MPNRLPVPEELLHLIEKRDVDEEVADDRRSGPERRDLDLGPLGTLESVSEFEELPLEERRSGTERRLTDERRKNG